MGGSPKFIHIDLAHSKLQIRIAHEPELTLYFDSPSRRFYLSVIALVVHHTKQAGRFTSVPLSVHLDSLVLLNETVGGAAGSAAGLIPRIYRKWKNVLPDLESAPLFKVVGRRREQDETGRVYRVSDGERDAWANLFEYKGSEQNVRLRFSADRAGIGLDDITMVYNDHLDAQGWERFIADLAATRMPVLESPVSPSPPTVSVPNHSLYRRVFVGRQSELAQLQSAFDGAISGEGGLVMIVGEPGIGKTALWEQLSRYVATRGGITLVGHSYEEGSLSLPYLPFVEALRAYVDASSVDDLRRRLGPSAADVARIVQEIQDKMSIEVPERRDPEEERYRLLQGVTNFIVAIGQAQPVLLVLEDLHNADPGTLEMLRHVGRFLVGSHLLLVGTFRDVEVDRTHPLSSALADLRRLPSYSRLILRGLDVDEVRRMCSAISNRGVQPHLGEVVHRQTEGNPLFVQEVVRYFAESGITDSSDVELKIPDGLKDVVGRRLSGLSPECNKLLAQAAVIGREFRLDVLNQVTELPEDSVFDALEEARKAAILEERSGLGGEVIYRFAHALFRQTLYEEIIAPRRIRFHQKVARALENSYKARLDEHAAELTEHYGHSSDPGDLAKAVAYGERAGARAASVYAYSEAARLLEQALAVQEILDPEDRAKRCDLLLLLSDALIYAGEARRVLDATTPEAFAIAETLGDRRRASLVCQWGILAVFYWAQVSTEGQGGPEAALWAERADRYADPDTVARVWADIAMGSHNCVKGMFMGDAAAMTEGVRLLHHAIDLAQDLHEPYALNWAVFTWLVYARAPQHHAERLALAEEFADAPFAITFSAGITSPVVMLTDVFLVSGLRERAEKNRRKFKDAVSRMGSLAYLGYVESMDSVVATIDGRLDEAIAISTSIADRSRGMSGYEHARVTASLCGVTPRLLLGRNEEAYEVAVAHKATLLAHLGKHAEAWDLLDKWVVARPNFGSDEDETGATLDTALLESAILVGHHKAADLLLTRLRSVADYAVILNRQTCIGRHLGAAAAMLGRPDEAQTYYGQAMELAQKLRFRPEISLIRLQQAELILDHYPAEKTTAQEYLDFAIAEFREMKIQPSLERAVRYQEIFKA